MKKMYFDCGYTWNWTWMFETECLCEIQKSSRLYVVEESTEPLYPLCSALVKFSWRTCCAENCLEALSYFDTLQGLYNFWSFCSYRQKPIKIWGITDMSCWAITDISKELTNLSVVFFSSKGTPHCKILVWLNVLSVAYQNDLVHNTVNELIQFSYL